MACRVVKRQAPGSRDGRRVYRDVLYDGYRLIVELDGRAAHPGDTRWKDIGATTRPSASGLMTLRYGWDDLRIRPCLVADQVYRALRRSGPVVGQAMLARCPVTRTSCEQRPARAGRICLPHTTSTRHVPPLRKALR